MTLSDEEKADRRAKRIEEKTAVTAQVSETCRFIGFGLLAIFYTIMAGDGEFAREMQSQWLLVYTMGICGALAIFFDYLQYVFGVSSVKTALERESLDYDDQSWAYKGREFSCKAKQLLVGIGAAALILTVLISTLGAQAVVAPSV